MRTCSFLTTCCVTGKKKNIRPIFLVCTLLEGYIPCHLRVKPTFINVFHINTSVGEYITVIL